LTENRLTSIANDLSAIARSVLTRNNLKIALVGEEKPLSRANGRAVDLMGNLENGIGDGFGEPAVSISDSPPREGWAASTAVSFVARSFETVRFGHPDAPAMSVAAKMLRSLFLHREIREKGGAYGGFSLYSPEDGQFCMASYRDPHIVNTLKIFENAFEFIRAGNFSDEDVKEAILQVCSEIDKPDPPGVAARKSFFRKILQLSDEARDRHKQKLLALNRERIVETAKKHFDPSSPKHAVAVISGEERLKNANEKLDEKPLAVFQI
jgi:Zn-dependent M16 (insulinase) family peptidase